MQAGVFNIVFAAGGADCRNIADMLHHGSDGDGRHNQNGGQIKLRHLERGQAHNIRLRHAGKIDHTAAQRDNIRNQHTHQNRDDFDHAFSPHIADDDNHHRKGGQPPVFRGVGHRVGGQDQADENDDRAGDKPAGKKRITRLIPTNFTTAAIIRYKRPATTIPPQA